MHVGREVLISIHQIHDDVIKWKHFPRNWPFVRGIHRSPVNSPHKGQWRGALMFTLICARINGWVNTPEAGDLRRNRPHYDVIVMCHILSRYSREECVYRCKPHAVRKNRPKRELGEQECESGTQIPKFWIRHICNKALCWQSGKSPTTRAPFY